MGFAWCIWIAGINILHTEATINKNYLTTAILMLRQSI